VKARHHRLHRAGTASRRGGSRNLGMRLSNNTSGLAGIRFEWRAGDNTWWPYVCSSWIDKSGRARRNSYSIERNGRRRALERAIEVRRQAGYPVPGLATALRALRRFLARG
jgi:hypothetical protein